MDNILDKISQKEFKEMSVQKTDEQFNFFTKLFPTQRTAIFFLNNEKLMIDKKALGKYLEEFLFITQKKFTNYDIEFIRETIDKFCDVLNQLDFEEKKVLVDTLLKKRTEIALAREMHSSRSTRKRQQASQSFLIKYLIM